MKKDVWLRNFCAVCAVALLAGCSGFSSFGQEKYTEEAPPADMDFAYRPDDGVLSEYTFEFFNYNDKYLITVSSPDERTIELRLENGRLSSSVLTVKAPDGYIADVPVSRQQAKMFFTAVNGMYHTGDIPQILRIDFYKPSGRTDENDVFSRYYAVSNGELAEIPVYIIGSDGRETIDSYPEMMTKMATPTAMMKLTDNDGELNICCYEFDYNSFRITAAECIEDDCEPLFQGYYKYYRAMKTYELLSFYDFDVSATALTYNGYKPSRDENYQTFSQLSKAAENVFADEYIEMSSILSRFDRNSEQLMVRPAALTNNEAADDILLSVNENSENENELTYWVVAGVSDGDGRVYYSAGIFTIEYRDGIWKAVTFSYPERP